jgi:hypothetical protein
MKALLSRGSAHTTNERNPGSPSSNAAKWPPLIGGDQITVYQLQTGEWLDRAT